MSLNEQLAVDDDPETAAFRAKCIDAIKRCNDPDLLDSMIVLKRMVEAKDAEIDRLKAELEQSQIQGHGYQLCETLLKALRAEAWHPIEKAEELGAKDGNSVLLFRIDYWAEGWWDSDYQCWMANDGEFKPSHFRFINPPEVVE